MDGYLELSEALQQNRLERADELCRQLLATAPSDVELLTLGGTLAYRRRDLQGALHHFEKAAALSPRLPQLQNNLGVLLQDLGRCEEAVARYLKALELRPEYAEATCNLGNALRALGRNGEAIERYRRAIATDPGYADAHLKLGNALRAEGQWQEAVQSYGRFLEQRPNHLSGWINLTGALQALNRFEEAIAAGEQAVRIGPASADAHCNLALALLATGDLRQGWREYEWRLRRADVVFSTTFAGRAMWDGAPLQGRTLLLRTEQGLGDALQFFRYARLLARQGARVILECRPEIHSLFAAQGCGVSCFVIGNDPPPFDTFAYMMSLPYLLGTTLNNIPCETPYLRADDSRAAAWRDRIGGRSGLKVGLVWAGSTSYKNDATRSLPLHLLEPLSRVPGIELFSLQLGAAARDLAEEPWGAAVHDLSGAIRDFSDTAAIMANLDLVVSVDTAVAHLAGAMGKRVLLMLPFSCDWRWLLERDDSPWYPTARIFRQRRRGEWSEVLERVARELSVLTVPSPSGRGLG